MALALLLSKPRAYLKVHHLLDARPGSRQHLTVTTSGCGGCWGQEPPDIGPLAEESTWVLRTAGSVAGQGAGRLPAP